MHLVLSITAGSFFCHVMASAGHFLKQMPHLMHFSSSTSNLTSAGQRLAGQVLSMMCAGILVAATDFDRFDGALVLDSAEEGELCRGMGGQEFRTKEGEIVLRDEKDIVCVLCQGADEKTRVGEDTRNVLFYAYGIPGVEGNHLRDGLTIGAETMRDFGEGAIQGVEMIDN